MGAHGATLAPEDVAEIEARRVVAEIVGDAASRRRARERLGLSLHDVAELCGLSIRSVWRREQTDAKGRDLWRLKRGSLETDAGYRYLTFLAKAQGKELPS